MQNKRLSKGGGVRPEEESRTKHEQHKELTDSEPERGIVWEGLTSPSPSHVVGHAKLQL